EGDLSETFADQIEKANMDTQSFSLLTVEAVPDEADCVLIYAPASDISTDEAEKLADYVAGGGKLMVVSGPLEDGGLTNLNTLLERYGVTVNEGIVVENDSDHFFYGYPYLLLPEINSADITDSLIAEKYNVLMPVAAGLTVSGESGAGTVTALLTTSDSAFSKTAGYNLTTYEKEEGDIDGPFALAVSIEDDSGGSLIWFSSSDFLEEQVNAYSSGANCDLAMNALSAMIGESEAISIRSKSLNYNYLTISDSTSSLLKVLMVGVIPLAFLGVGVCVVLQKRRRQNESV
ncbi:MAG: GldG family protein, partial [Oscillospiraceae bacterium]|nr:GldG family protein [Oscillospiraceae bacterium]